MSSEPAAPDFERKIVAPERIAEAVARLPRPVVFTNGVFDILHRGHATYLAEARALGASLIVALNGDDSVRRLGKGEDRPVNPLPDRLALVAALESVSLVSWFDEDTPLSLILAARPDVLVKGGDYGAEQVVGADIVRRHGGTVQVLGLVEDCSTTAIVERIQRDG